MSFLSAFFLWASMAAAVPIIIALWNRKKLRKEAFGGFYLLQKILESSSKKIRIYELIKMINRVVMILALVLVFADPIRTVLRMAGAQEGFAIILDVSRSMQQGNLIDLQRDRLKEVLKRMPSSSRGVIMAVADDCSFIHLSNKQQTANAQAWTQELSRIRLGYENTHLTTRGLSSCSHAVQSLFGRDILKIFISPLAKTFDEVLLEKLSVEVLQTEPVSRRPEIQVSELVGESSVQFQFDEESVNASLIDIRGRVEPLGRVASPLEIFPDRLVWLWLQGDSAMDPWVNQSFFSVRSFQAHEVNLWAQRETEAYISLLTALRAHPRIKVIRQIGGEPVGDNIVLYHNYSRQIPNARRLWYFLGEHSTGPFEGRDVKRWTSGGLSSDVRKSFQMKSENGPIFIKQYHLLKLDGLDVIETFDDGAPFLLQDRSSSKKIWISPFDLEDLTTDFTLEPTFIPYLFRRLDEWLNEESAGGELVEAELIWGLPGHGEPLSEVTRQKKWPGLYRQQDQYEMIGPIDLPQEYYHFEKMTSNQELVQENISLRPTFFQILMASIFVELFLCLLTLKSFMASIFLIFILTSSGLWAGQKNVVGMLGAMEANRQVALEQLIAQIARQSNLDFASPRLVRPQEFWKAPVVFFSSDKEWAGFEPSEREIVRDYLDRGGLLIFDDPLAIRDSSFFKSVQREFEKVLPGRTFQEIPKDDVVFRSFYMLNEVSGRRLSSPHLEGISIDNRWAVIFSFNDLLGASLRAAGGDFVFSVSPFGMMQRILSQRLLLNLLMYGLTLHYKDDAIHLPHILRRRVK